ncbi:MAG: hypothetical protein M3219_00300 [Thermoproteota archaeon]|nr:hypothetical protein [Thermoproteota archaeon]
MVLPGNRTIAIGMSFFEFTGSALVFHTTRGEPFTITYPFDVQAKSVNQ